MTQYSILNKTLSLYIYMLIDKHYYNINKERKFGMRSVTLFVSTILKYFILAILFVVMFYSCSDESNPMTPDSSVPVVTTVRVDFITSTTTQCEVIIDSEGQTSVTARGVCWSTTQEPTISDNKTNEDTGSETFKSIISGLSSGTTYHVRAYATNGKGTGYGETRSFTTTTAITDIDGNLYQTVKIGTQVWMAENLKVSRYRNGEEIPNLIKNSEWKISHSNGAYCDYNNDSTMAAAYGHLYNWHAIEDNRQIAPEGWHVPTDAEWQKLEVSIGGSEIAGGKLKERGTTYWRSPNEGATNESSFSALPGGYRNSNGGYYSLGGYAFFWSSTEHSNTYSWSRRLVYFDSSMVREAEGKLHGLSVRCVKD